MNSKRAISIIWLMFAILFFILASRHKAESKQTIPKFEIEIRSTGSNINFIGVDFREFVNKFNAYVAYQNESNRRANLLAYYGYLLAGLTALVSLVFEWREYILAKFSKNNK